MSETFEQLDELLVTLGASVDGHEVVDLAVGRWLLTTRKETPTRSSRSSTTRPRLRSARSKRSAEFLGESDEKPFRPADVAEPICVFILDDFAYELRAALAEPLRASRRWSSTANMTRR